ncbi:MAG TPA: hypothetical protein VEU51_04900 [Candidatus Acidoferrales bacterium]|nr:hypothetical protein [Candidatus Acidoferrales bacterium]
MTRCIIISGIFAAVLAATLVVRDAGAQSTLEVPGPAQQSGPNFRPPAAQPPPSQPSEDLPQQYNPPPPYGGEPIQLPPIQLFITPPPAAPPPIAAQPSQPPPLAVAPMTSQSNPVLPAVFRGCWQGQVNQLEWIRREPGARKIGFWTPKTYRLCYKRVGDHPFTLTFTETGVEPNEKIFNPHGNVVPISSNGRDFANLRAQLHFDEYGAGRNLDASSFAVDETTNLDCRIDGERMRVSASVYGTRDGEPWFRARWRTEFTHFAE